MARCYATNELCFYKNRKICRSDKEAEKCPAGKPDYIPTIQGKCIAPGCAKNKRGDCYSVLYNDCEGRVNG